LSPWSSELGTTFDVRRRTIRKCAPQNGDTRERQEMPLFAKSMERRPLNTNPAATANAYRRTTKMLKEIAQQAGFETISAHRMSNHGMKRPYFPGLIDIVVVTDPAEIRTISNDSRSDRDFILHGPVRNVQRLRKMLRVFSLDGRLFEPALPRKTNCGRD
jgi:hypothetical protein